MKRLKRISRILLVVTAVMMIGLNAYEFIMKDKEPPVISFPDGELSVSIAATDKELVQDVKAKDNRSGDISSSVVVEKMSSIDENASRVVTYAAIDKAGNVGRQERLIAYTDYTKPRFDLAEPLRFPLEKIPDNVMEGVTVSSSIDGDISEKVKFQFLGDYNYQNAGVMDIEIRVVDSAGVNTVLPTKLEWYDPKEETIPVTLTQYIVYLEAGAEFNPNDYLSEVDPKAKVQVESDVDTSTAGVYHVEYLVESGNNQGKSRLIVVVE